jgi:hypothetical protein
MVGRSSQKYSLAQMKAENVFRLKKLKYDRTLRLRQLDAILDPIACLPIGLSSEIFLLLCFTDSSPKVSETGKASPLCQGRSRRLDCSRQLERVLQGRVQALRLLASAAQRSATFPDFSRAVPFWLQTAAAQYHPSLGFRPRSLDFSTFKKPFSRSYETCTPSGLII